MRGNPPPFESDSGFRLISPRKRIGKPYRLYRT